MRDGQFRVLELWGVFTCLCVYQLVHMWMCACVRAGAGHMCEQRTHVNSAQVGLYLPVGHKPNTHTHLLLDERFPNSNAGVDKPTFEALFIDPRELVRAWLLFVSVCGVSAWVYMITLTHTQRVRARTHKHSHTHAHSISVPA